MKRIIRLTERDLTRIVRRVIKESDVYRGKFKDQDYWIDDKDNKTTYTDFDKDLASVGYYEDDPSIEWVDFKDETEYENWNELPDDLPDTWSISKKYGEKRKEFFDRYKETYGPLRLAKRK